MKNSGKKRGAPETRSTQEPSTWYCRLRSDRLRPGNIETGERRIAPAGRPGHVDEIAYIDDNRSLYEKRSSAVPPDRRTATPTPEQRRGRGQHRHLRQGPDRYVVARGRDDARTFARAPNASTTRRSARRCVLHEPWSVVFAASSFPDRLQRLSTSREPATCGLTEPRPSEPIAVSLQQLTVPAPRLQLEHLALLAHHEPPRPIHRIEESHRASNGADDHPSHAEGVRVTPVRASRVEGNALGTKVASCRHDPRVDRVRHRVSLHRTAAPAPVAGRVPRRRRSTG